MTTCYEKYKKRMLWKHITTWIEGLSNNGDMTIHGHHDYVIGYLVKQLSEKFKISKKRLVPRKKASDLNNI